MISALFTLALAATSACSDGGSAGGGSSGTLGAAGSSGSSGAPAAGGSSGSSGGGSADCCQAKEAAGCGDSSVQQCVCQTDSVCCESTWDATCVEIATSSCGAACGGGVGGSAGAGAGGAGGEGGCVASCEEGAGGPGTGKPCTCSALCEGQLKMECMPSFGSPGTRCICSKDGTLTAHNTPYTGSVCGALSEVQSSWKACGFPEATFQLP
jgi:hypothetical protein